MYDDNATPEWALFWSHNLSGTRPKGWTVAHVWPASENIDAYTHPANLALVPESLASLTDKEGPLTRFLRYHAFQVYSPLKFADAEQPDKPEGYEEIKWRYLEPEADPVNAIQKEFNSRNNQRTRILRPFMEHNDWK